MSERSNNTVNEIGSEFPLLRNSRNICSPSPEQPLQVRQLQLHVGWTPVVALAGVGGWPPSGGAGRSSPRPTAGARRVRCRDRPWVPQTAPSRSVSDSAAPLSAKSSARSRTSPAASASPSRAGVSRTSTAPGPNGSSTRPSSASSGMRAHTRSASAGSSLHHLRQQQGLARHRAPRHLDLHPLVDQPFVGGVLVHHHDAVRGSGPRYRSHAPGRGRRRAGSPMGVDDLADCTLRHVGFDPGGGLLHPRQRQGGGA